MHTITTTVHFILNTLMLVMMMKIVLSPKDFYFSPILRPVDFIAEPLLKRLRQLFRPTRTGRDTTPFVAIFLLLIIQTLYFFVLIASNPITAITLSIRSTVLFLLQFSIICTIVSVSISPFIVNPLARFLLKFLKPLERLFVPVGASRILRFVILIASLLVVTTLIWHSLFVFHHPINQLNSDREIIAFDQIRNLSQKEVLVSGRFWLNSAITVLIHAIRTYHFFIFALILGAAFSWVNLDPRNPFIQLIYSITEPILMPFRRAIPSMGGIDFSPFIAIILISLIGNLVIAGLNQIHFMLLPG